MNKIRLYIVAAAICIFLIIIFTNKNIFEESNTTKQQVNDVLKLAGKNRIELQKVIDHYNQSKKDSLKLRAAFFLISNMPGHYFYQGLGLSKFDQIFDIIADKERDRPLVGNIHFPVIYASWDSLVQLYGPLRSESLVKVQDYEVIKSGSLIENIEYAFKAWQYPWARKLSFDQFCNYVLPYRFEHEAIESWRPIFMKKYEWLTDSMQGNDDPIRACNFINQDIKKWLRFNEVFNKYPTAISPRNMLKAKMGKCLDQAAIVNYAMRAMGIPVSHEIIPQWADRSMGHDFSSVLNKDGKFIDFLGGELEPGKNEIRSTAPKIYRSMYAINKPVYFKAKSTWETVPPNLRDIHIQDVTREYLSVSNVNIKAPSNFPKFINSAYLCVFDNEQWIPVAGAKLDGQRLVFNDVGRNAVYLPAYYNKGLLVPFSLPFILFKNGQIKALKPNFDKMGTVRLTRKYPLNGIKLWWLTLMGRGQFQGAHLPNFQNPVPLFTIPDTIEMRMNISKVAIPGKYRYLRYLFPPDKSGSLGEIAFYSHRNPIIPLGGKLIAANGVDSLDSKLAFDGKLDAFIDRTPNNEYNGLWIGLDLGQRKMVTYVGYSPRNDRNSILAGMDYELMYWDEKWKTLNRRIAPSDDGLVFKNVPSGTLLLLHNHTEGKEERIFQYENNHQIWW